MHRDVQTGEAKVGLPFTLRFFYCAFQIFTNIFYNTEVILHPPSFLSKLSLSIYEITYSLALFPQKKILYMCPFHTPHSTLSLCDLVKARSRTGAPGAHLTHPTYTRIFLDCNNTQFFLFSTLTKRNIRYVWKCIKTILRHQKFYRATGPRPRFRNTKVQHCHCHCLCRCIIDGTYSRPSFHHQSSCINITLNIYIFRSPESLSWPIALNWRPSSSVMRPASSLTSSSQVLLRSVKSLYFL